MSHYSNANNDSLYMKNDFEELKSAALYSSILNIEKRMVQERNFPGCIDGLCYKIL
jgi:hypothetical protein